MASKIRSCRFGEPRKRGEGLRIGTVRYLPRGIKKEELAIRDYFDVWFPTLAPSAKLIGAYKERLAKEEGAKGGPREGSSKKAPATIQWFTRNYLRELKGSTDARHALQLLAAISKRTNITIGCYCADEERCHRLILRDVIEKIAQGL